MSTEKQPATEAPGNSEDWETRCPKREDGWHCRHWYDGDACCACGDPAEVLP